MLSQKVPDLVTFKDNLAVSAHMARKRSSRKRSTKKSGYILTFYANRNTPRVHRAGTKPPKPKKGYGKRVKSRRASAAEVKKMRGGKWLRVDAKGRTPSSKSYKGRRSKGNGPSMSARRKAVRNRRRR